MVKNIILDFDSTISSLEMLEILAEVSLRNNPSQNRILKRIQDITELGMNGEISFEESLSSRLSLLTLDQQVMEDAYEIINQSISKSFSKNIGILQKTYNTFIISGGFINLVGPVLKNFGISESNIFANNLVMQNNMFDGVDINNPLAHPGGKVEVMKLLKLKPEETINIGDGMTDFEIRKEGYSSKFIYYKEFVSRPKVEKLADQVVDSFDDFAAILNSWVEMTRLDTAKV